MITEAVRNRFVWVLAAVAMVLALAVLPVGADSVDYAQTLDRLDRLQTLAQQYMEEKGSSADPVDLTLGFTRVGEYNTTVWQLTAGVRDPEFESYATGRDPDLWDLQNMTTAVLPNGQTIDMGHLLASINLVYRGMPLAGSWGGDCMQLAQVYAGQAGDAGGYAALMRQTFAIDDDGTVSRFGDQDLRADLDSVVAGSRLTKDSRIADVLRDYYDGLDDYNRAYQFIALSFGAVDTSNTAAFADQIYNALIKDTGMQLLLYMNQMWGKDGWTVLPESEPALRGACTVLAEYLSSAVNGEKVKAASSTLMHTLAGQALVDALNAIGDSEAASNAQQAVDQAQSGGAASTSGEDALTSATQKLKTGFNAQMFQLVLLIIGAAAILGMVVCIALLVSHRKNRQ